MGIQTNLKFVGTKGNIIYYRHRDMYCIRTKPASYRQSAEGKIRSSNFAIAAKCARVMRNGMTPVLPFPKDKRMQNRLTAAFTKWLNQYRVEGMQPMQPVPYIGSFQFNESIALQERFKVPFTVLAAEKEIQVSMPAFIPIVDISAPANTISVELMINVSSCILKDGTDPGSFTTTLLIPYNDGLFPEQTLKLPVRSKQGKLTLLTAALSYNLVKNGNSKKNSNVAFMPCGIFWAKYN